MRTAHNCHCLHILRRLNAAASRLHHSVAAPELEIHEVLVAAGRGLLIGNGEEISAVPSLEKDVICV